jgi:hypothetical protein
LTTQPMSYMLDNGEGTNYRFLMHQSKFLKQPLVRKRTDFVVIHRHRTTGDLFVVFLNFESNKFENPKREFSAYRQFRESLGEYSEVYG